MGAEDLFRKSQGGRIELEDGRKLFGKNINENPTTYFTEDVMKRIDEFCAKKYKFGSEEIVEEGEDDDGEV